jgi:oligogalacturonide lyase
MDGVRLRQVTAHPSIHHHPFFFVPAYDGTMRRLFFISHRTGRPEIFGEHCATRQIEQLTECEQLNPWSIHPSRISGGVYFTTAEGGRRLDPDTGRSDEVVRFPVSQSGGRGVGSGMGTTAISSGDRYWAIAVAREGAFDLTVIDLQSGRSQIILRGRDIGHMQFCPDDPELLFYAGPLTDRVWSIRVDGSEHRRLFERDAGAKQWITHEVWLPGTSELILVDWPHRLIAVHARTLARRTVARFNAWHPSPHPRGRWLVADTNHPDIGIQILDPRRDDVVPTPLCHSYASGAGSHWAGPFPYDHGPISVHAPQHTHAHPSFSPDGQRVVFTSDCSGHAQVYELELPPEFGSDKQPEDLP